MEGYSIRRDVDGIVTVDVRNDTDGSSLNLYTRTDERLAVIVDHRTGNGPVLSGKDSGKEEQSGEDREEPRADFPKSVTHKVSELVVNNYE